MKIRVFYILALLLLLLSSPILKVARCQSNSDVEFAEVAEDAIEGGDLGIIGDDVQDFGDGSFSPSSRHGNTVVAGEESELLVGLKNEVLFTVMILVKSWQFLVAFATCNWELIVNVIAIKASVHLPYDHRMPVQNLTAQVRVHCGAKAVKIEDLIVLASAYLVLVYNYATWTILDAFNNASVPPSAQATFSYIFAVSKFLQAGTFDLVGTIVYEIDQFPYQSTFYNGTFEVTEAGGPLRVESVFLFCLGISLLGLLGLWIHGQIQHLSKVDLESRIVYALWLALVFLFEIERHLFAPSFNGFFPLK
ncbi:translocon-associated protein (TRAP), alpha subunit [Actinidia rufa]|uniref:Translocon-associated protein (TRAP), alpha subunit n=1 Tax=Actinidia rufa TaxID=165716 RepID=A0A7J0ETP0_9ERIC|nr:translocon-associated protein (TRAP), alpha subunit [Actinidia rufa]